MARSFTGGGTDKIAYTVFTPSGVANSISVWFYQTSAQNVSSYYVVNDNAGGSPHWGILPCGTVATKMTYYFQNVAIDPGTANFSLNVWNHVAVVMSGSGANTQAYLNGVADGSSASSWIPSPNSITMNLGNNAANSALGGRIADFAVWNGIALTAAEVSALATGARPYTIRPSSLQIYSPLDGLASPEPDLSGKANNGTLTGTALAAGPPVMQFTPRAPQFIIRAAAAAPSSFNPAWTRNRNLVIEGIAT